MNRELFKKMFEIIFERESLTNEEIRISKEIFCEIFEIKLSTSYRWLHEEGLKYPKKNKCEDITKYHREYYRNVRRKKMEN